MSVDQPDPLDECRTLLRRLAHERFRLTTQECLREREAAADRVFDDLVKLDGYAGIQIKREQQHRAIKLSLYGASAHVTFHHEEGFAVHGVEKFTPIALIYNVVDKVFESDEPDNYRTPVPGHPVAKRAATGVILDALIRNLPPSPRW